MTLPEPDQPDRTPTLSTIERAFELARSGACRSIDDIRRQLERERYTAVGAHLSGPTIRLQLRQLCRDQARSAPAAAAAPPA